MAEQSFKHAGLTVDIELDDSGYNPFEDNDGMWKTYSFNTHHINFKEPEELGLGPLDESGEPTVTDPDLKRKLKVGLAFILSYYEHGEGYWFIKGTRTVQYPQWDLARIAGLMVWEEPAGNIGAKTYKARQKDAEAQLDEYNKWASGQVYGVIVKKGETELESLWGLIGLDYAIKTGKELAADHAGK